MNILVTDDHPLFRDALIRAVSQGLPEATVLGVASVAALQQALHEILPDLVLLDLHLPDASGFSGLVHVRAQYPELPVIVVSAHEEPTVIQRAMAHGAAAYITKSAAPEQMIHIIQTVLAGEEWLPPWPLSHAVMRSDELNMAERLRELTPQQYRVLLMLAEGQLNKQIAYDLSVSEATIKAHMTAIFRKLGVQNRTQAVLALGTLGVDSVKLG
ncbi:MAG: response regulator transcription factor [Pseudomonadota bacterium]|nr:response regulator transcription factor [Pseudomonadota bacterium]